MVNGKRVIKAFATVESEVVSLQSTCYLLQVHQQSTMKQQKQNASW